MLFVQSITAMIFYTLTLYVREGYCSRRHTIYWDESITPELKTEMKIDVHVNDWMDILCPHKTNYNKSSVATSSLYLDLYNVTAEQYDQCLIRGQRRVLHCKDPRQEIKLTTKFQKRSPSPIGFVFQPGHTYFYMSQPIKMESRGCTENTMKLAVKVLAERRRDKYKDAGSNGVSDKDVSNSLDNKLYSSSHHPHHKKKNQFKAEAGSKSGEGKFITPQASRNPSGSNNGHNNALSALKSTTKKKFIIYSVICSLLTTSLLAGEPYA